MRHVCAADLSVEDILWCTGLLALSFSRREFLQTTHPQPPFFDLIDLKTLVSTYSLSPSGSELIPSPLWFELEAVQALELSSLVA